MGTPILTKIIIAPKNRKYIYFDDQFILYKSDPQSDEYDVLAFARRDIEEVIIPNFIKIIGTYTFNNGKSLRNIEIQNDSKLETIEKFAFSDSSIEKLVIPSNIKYLKNKWCYQVNNLINITISPDNENYIYVDDNFILSKSSAENETFDVLVFARRNIKEAIIPKYIKIIGSCAFDSCNILERVEIPEDSELQFIDKYAFIGTQIEEIYIPKHVKKIGNNAFSNCEKLRIVVIDDESELLSIEKGAFYLTNIESITITNCLKTIGDGCFSNCENLKMVDIKCLFYKMLVFLHKLQKLVTIVLQTTKNLKFWISRKNSHLCN